MPLYQTDHANSAHDELMRTQFANQVSLTHLANIDLRNRTVLDPGCGVSTSLAAFLYEKGATYHLLDFKQTTVDTMGASLLALGLPCNVSQGDITNLPFADDSFDCVHERLVLMHVSNPAAGIRECLRIAREAAFFVSIDWSTFRWDAEWVGEFYHEAVAFVEGRGSNMSWGGRIKELLPPGTNFTDTPYPRPYGDHGYIVSSLCDTLLGILKKDSDPDQRLLRFFTETSETAEREGAWVTPALMNVITVLKESSQETGPVERRSINYT